MSSKCIREMNREVMKFSDLDRMFNHPKVHIGLNSLYLQMREEIRDIKPYKLNSRRTRLMELYKNDFLQEDAELREVDKAYIDTQM